MLSIAHTLTSLPLGIYLQNPLAIVAAAFIFHLFLDTLPHWNIYPDEMKTYPAALVALDVLGGLIVAWLLLGNSLFAMPILAAIAGGNLPDVMHGLWDMLNSQQQKQAPKTIKQIFKWHDQIQIETRKIWPGLVAQIIVVAAALKLIFV